MDPQEAAVFNNRQTNVLALRAPTGSNVVVTSIQSVYSVRWVSIILQCYMVLVLFEYICFFGAMPFEEVDHRPSIHFINAFFLMLTVLGSLMLLPISGSTFPTQVAYYSHLGSTMLQFTSSVLCIATTVALFRTKDRMLIPLYDEESVVNHIDCTTYMRVHIILTLVGVVFAFVLSCVNTYIYGKALFRLANGINRKSNDPDSQAFERVAQELQNMETDMGTRRIMPKEIIKTLKAQFV